MRIKLDENLPVTASEPFRAHGHDVDTVADEQLSGAPDADVLSAASSQERLVVTLDRGFGDLRAHPPGTLGERVVWISPVETWRGIFVGRAPHRYESPGLENAVTRAFSVVETGVDPVTSRFSGARSAN